MSIQVIARVLPKRWGSPSRKIVALKLADVAREDGTNIYPSIATVAAQAELSERQVQRVMDGFRREGLLIVVRPGGGRQKPTEYRFNMELMDQLPNANPKQGAEREAAQQNDDNMTPIESERVTLTASKGDGQSPNPSSSVVSPFSKEQFASGEDAIAPSVSKKIWQEGQNLLSNGPSKPQRSIIGKWLRRTPTNEDKEKLLVIIRAAVRAGTADPIAYVTKALNREFPPLPEPKFFDFATWQRNCKAATRTKAWAPVWGPPPGKKGCLMPTELITPDLMKSLQERKVTI